MPKTDEQILGGRYTLCELLSESEDRQSWSAEDKWGNGVLVKLWQFRGKEPDAVQRALFNVELRNLFRLSGLPGACDKVLTIRDAGVERNENQESGCFILVLNTPGFCTLADLLRKRGQHEWLCGLDTLRNRITIWKSFYRIAKGLAKIHDCQMLHRAISPKVIYLDHTEQPESMKLGGFEWTIRLTAGDTIVPMPPGTEDSARPFSFESDWFAFGVMLANVFCVANVNPHNKEYARSLVQAVKISSLSDLEQQTIIQFLSPDIKSQPNRSEDILHDLGQLIEVLERPRQSGKTKLALVCALGEEQALTEAILGKISEKNPDSDISPSQMRPQIDFIERDLRTPTVVRNRGRSGFVLLGTDLDYAIYEYNDHNVSLRNWQIAYCGNADVVNCGKGEDQRKLENVRISVFNNKQFRDHRQDIIAEANDWSSQLPLEEEVISKERDIQKYHDFFRVTNQVELLMRNAEIFSYKMESYQKSEGEEIVEISETQRDFPKYFRRHDMITMLGHEFSEGNKELVFLGNDSAMVLNTHVSDKEYWEIIGIDSKKGLLRLKRSYDKSVEQPKKEGYLRTRGMFGQVHLLMRRKKAIDRLSDHAHLLSSLLHPNYNYIDAPVGDLPCSINEGLSSQNHLDEAKVEAIERIWRIRPLFLLQGPPGTGKTTLVASLLKQIFAESDVSQVLVTAQAHPAVDVLRKRVNDSLGKSPESRDFPLSIRIPKSLDTENSDPDNPRPTAKAILEKARDAIDINSHIPVQRRWRESIDKLLCGLQTVDAEAGEFVDLVKRSANITYSSSTSGALAELAESPLSFDWSIIEESGKAHGFDLVLPLQNAYRWLLIGDHKQLPPYRDKDFSEALANGEDLFERLDELPAQGGKLVDRDLIRLWGTWSGKERQERQKKWGDWLRVFRDTFKRCEQFESRKACGQLNRQHRMHPTIAEMISTAFYKGDIVSKTVDETNGLPLKRVVHPFVAPEDIRGKAIVWLDVPRPKKFEAGEQTEHGLYTSELEVDATLRFLAALRRAPVSDTPIGMAVLSPYKAQVSKLANGLREFYQSPPDWLKPLPKGQHRASTVDSFQGNQSGLVIVSLVRNNHRTMPQAFGFLREDERINVLLSRAKRLLVLVGSWEFFRENLKYVNPGSNNGASDDRIEPLKAWKRTIDYLALCIDNGTALKIPVASLPELKS